MKLSITGVDLWLNFQKLTELAFPRALKPPAAVGKPELIIFSDGSEVAFEAAAYMRWEVQKGKFEARLIMAKSRMARLKKMDIVGTLIIHSSLLFICFVHRYRTWLVHTNHIMEDSDNIRYVFAWHT